MFFNTKIIYLSAGRATGGTSLNAFDNAMRAARIADFNIIRVTSIVPPGVKVVKLSKGEVIKGCGLMLPAVYAHEEREGDGEVIAAGVGVGVPLGNCPDTAGVIFTASGSMRGIKLRALLKQMIEEGMREMRLITEYSFKCVVAETVSSGAWCSVFAAAAFCDEDLGKVIGNRRISD